MDLNVKLQGLKYNYEKVQGCFRKILRFQWFLRFMELFFLRKIRKICPRGCGPGLPASAHRSTDFIKHRPLFTGSTTRIKSIESISPLLISVVHHRFDDWDSRLRSGAVRARARGGVSPSSATAHRSSSFLELRWSGFDEICSYGIRATRGTCLC
jgi:hypothetical protein